MSISEIVIRLLAAIAAGGLIGYEREKKGRDAGFRTHILVAVGACVLALIQVQSTNLTLLMASTSETAKTVLSADNTRLIAQIVSGIGFLGAGTIIVTHNNVSGLTTAASIWAVAGFGIALGLGFYVIAVAGIVAALLTLLLIKRIFRFPNMRLITASYHGEVDLSEDILAYLQENRFRLMRSTESVALHDGTMVHNCEYRIDMKTKKPDHDILMEIAELGSFRTLEISDPQEEP